jgi:cytosine/adenosine deaminase-related metal-dependent hydrolase
MYERLASRERGHFTAEALGTAMTWDGHASLGWPEAGEIAPGSLADLITVGLDSPRLAGIADRAASDATRDATPRPGGTAGNPRADGVPGRGEPDLALLEAVIFAATPADVHSVVIGGRDVVIGGEHQLVPDVSVAISAAVHAVLG